ncbi:MAG: hypothetical protein HFF11_05455 [Angelakisella sp.]|nr:hypothetical protein [Angelakisella sp.]
MKRLLAFFLVLGLLAGCGPQLEKYPRVESSSQGLETQTLTIDIPQEADQLTLDAVSQLAAALLELSGGAITLEVYPSRDPARALRTGDTHLALLDNSGLMAADPSLSFLDWPFLMEDEEQWLTIMGAEDGVVRGSASLREALNGEVIGLWYQGRTVLLGRGSFYEEIGFAGAPLGVLEGREAPGFFQGIGDLNPKTVSTGDGETLLKLLSSREVKYIEYPLGKVDPDTLPELVKHLEDTAHRVEGSWLVLGKGAVDQKTAQIIRAAAAAVPQPAWNARARREEELFQALEAREITVQKRPCPPLRRAAKEYFRKNGKGLGCRESTLERLIELVS